MKKPTIHLICNAHLDPVWQWQWEEGCAETISTFRNAVKLLKEERELIFNHNESILYRWILKYDPKLFKTIQFLVEQGKWCISGGWYLQPDVNLPDTESIFRHIMEGRHFFKKYFDAEPKVAYNFDSFGHSGGLPQLLKQAGYSMYIHMRPQQPDLDIPADIYRWQGIDGSEILGCRISIGLYHTEYENIDQRLKEGVAQALQLKRDVPVFWGIGDHGGGATREDLEKINNFIRQENRVEIKHSTPDHFYDAIKELAKKAPLYHGNLQRVFTGCYTSLSRLKREAVRSFHELKQTEILTTLCWWQNDCTYPNRQLSQAWLSHLFNDFHDILPGSCIEPAEQDALDLYGKVRHSLRELKLEAACVLNRGIDYDAYIPITILNTHPNLRKIPVEVECMISHRPKWEGLWYIKLFNIDGKEIPCQEEQPDALLPFNGWRRKICFMADVPSLGKANFYAEAVEGRKTLKEVKPSLKFKLNSTSGFIEKLWDQNFTNYLSGPLMKPLVIEDEGDSWGTDRWNYRTVIGEFSTDPASIKIIENGPIRTIHQSIHVYNHSRITMNLVSYTEWPVLEYRLRIQWNETKKRLKLSIPTVFKKDQPRCEIPGGYCSYPSDGDEYVQGRWLVLGETTKDKNTGIAVINSGQHGFDCLDGELRISILRAAVYCHERSQELDDYPNRKYMDQGLHDVRLLIVPGIFDDLIKQATRLADWMNTPPVGYSHLPFGNTNEQTADFLHWDAKSIRLLALKKAENEQAMILRLQETSGDLTNCRISLKYPNITINVRFRPLEIQTILIKKDGTWQIIDPVYEKPIP